MNWNRKFVVSFQKQSATALLVGALAAGYAPAVFACGGCDGHDGDAHTHDHDHAHTSAGMPNVTSFASQTSVLRNSATTAGTFSFVVVADTQGNSAAEDGIAAVGTQVIADIQLLQNTPGLVVFPGDLVGVGTVSNFQEWKNGTNAFSTGNPYASGAIGADRRLMVPGNHDLPGRSATNGDWQNEFNWLPDSQVVSNVTTADPNDTVKGIDQMDYYYDINVNGNDLRFISVTTDRDYLPGERGQDGVPSQYNDGVLGGQPTAIDWFQSVMAMDSTKNKDHVFVMTHHPITSSPFDNLGQNGNPPGGTAGEWWKSIAGTSDEIDGAAAAALFTGHMHMYQPSRPDPNSDTSEIIIGTGGGKPEGVLHRQVHGFMEVTVQGGNVMTRFWGDANGATGGYSFTDILDEYIIAADGGLPRGELALYNFDSGSQNQDSSTSILSKDHELNFHGGAQIVNDAQRGGDVLRLTNNGFADAKALGDNNLSVLRDLVIEVGARAEFLEGDSNSGNTFQNVLVSFGDADGATTTSGGVNTQHPNDELANYTYMLSYNQQGQLRLSWEYFDDPTINATPQLESVVSTVSVADPTQWHDIRVERDAETKTVRFIVDGEQLGDMISFDHLPTGGGAGSLYIGASADGAAGAGAGDFDGWLDTLRLSSEDISLLVGDNNGDGFVGGADLDILYANWGKSVSKGNLLAGDWNADGTVGVADLNLLLGNWSVGTAPSASVPEPGTAAGMVALMLMCTRRGLR